MEDYIAHCLDSLLIEDNRELLDVLVINDGSKDKTSEIAHAYERKYPNVFRVIDKENGNYGSCINRGLKEATGKYVKILDADDRFDTNNFNDFVTFLKGFDVDLILSDFAIVDNNGNRTNIKEYHLSDKNNVVSINDICTLPQFINMEMHAVTYRTEIFHKIGYMQSEGISYTDQQWIFTPMAYTKTAICFNKIIYYYLIGRAGQTIDPKIKIRSITNMSDCLIENVKQFEKRKGFININLTQYLTTRLKLTIRDFYAQCLFNYTQSTKQILLKFDSELQFYSQYIYTYIENGKNKRLKFNQIKLWRKYTQVPIPAIRLLSKIYILLSRINSIFKR